MKKILTLAVILTVALQLAALGISFATHSATVTWVKTSLDDQSYLPMPGAPNEYFWNGTVAKWINFTVKNNGPDPIREVKIVFEKDVDGNSMFNFSRTSQNKAGWYATPDEFGPNKRPTVLYFRTDSQFIGAGETVRFDMLMTQGPTECRHNIDVWTVDAGNPAATNFYELWILIDQHSPAVQIMSPANGTVFNAQYSPSVDVVAKATDLNGPHLSGIKNATLRVDYIMEPSVPKQPTQYFTMKYNAVDKLYHLNLIEGGGLIDEAWHNCTVGVFDYAENGPVYSYSDQNQTIFFWFKPKPPVSVWTTDPCFLSFYGKQPVGHVGSNVTVQANTGFHPNSVVRATFNTVPPTTLGQSKTNAWGKLTLTFQIPELPRNHTQQAPKTTLPYQIVLTDDSTPPVITEINFTIIPWMELDSSSPRVVHVGDEVKVNGRGFDASVGVNVLYRDVSMGAVHYASTDEWSDDATHLVWSPYLDNLVVSPTLPQLSTDSKGSVTLTFTVPESYGGWHPIFGQEAVTGVRSGWMPDVQPKPIGAFPEAAFVKVMTQVSTDPTIGVGGQYIEIYATGLPLPDYNSSTFDCRTGQNITDNHNWTLALDFGAIEKYWVFENGFILNGEFDYIWSQQLYLPFAYWYNHNDPTSPTWKGTLYWKDAQGQFRKGSQFLRVPPIPAGNYDIALYEFNRQTQVDQKQYLATTTFTVIKDPLYVRVTSGTMYFKGENVTAYAEVDLDGTATDATDITFQLYHEDTLFSNLASEHTTKGLYTASFTCPSESGNYFLKVNATKVFDYFALNGFGVSGFTVSPTLDGLNATITALSNGLATVITDIGTLTLNLNDIGGKVTSIQGSIVTINTDIGRISTDISTINGKLVQLDNIGTNVATIQTDIGTIKATLDSINAKITAIGADTVNIRTAVGDIQGKVTAIQGKTVEIETNIGQVSTTAESIQTLTGLQPTSIALSLIAAVAAIIAAILVFRKLYV